MENISFITQLIFITSAVFVVFMLYKATGYSKMVLGILLSWMAILSALAMNDFYRDTDAIPPRFVFMVGPPLLLILFLFISRKGRAYLDKINAADLTLMQTVRLPVEIVLHQLFLASAIPQIMTYEGYNFDIITGITAPVVYYLYFVRKALNQTVMVLWNCLCLLLLFTIVYIAIFSAETPFQKYAFDQPNVAVTYYPFVWLPGIIVPAALFGHLVSLRRLTNKANPA